MTTFNFVFDGPARNDPDVGMRNRGVRFTALRGAQVTVSQPVGVATPAVTQPGSIPHQNMTVTQMRAKAQRFRDARAAAAAAAEWAETKAALQAVAFGVSLGSVFAIFVGNIIRAWSERPGRRGRPWHTDEGDAYWIDGAWVIMDEDFTGGSDDPILGDFTDSKPDADTGGVAAGHRYISIGILTSTYRRRYHGSISAFTGSETNAVS